MSDIQDNYAEVIKTKVTPEVRARLEAISNKFGISTFKMLRMLIDCMMRFMDSETNLSEDLLRIIRMFEGLPNWKHSICLAAGTEKMEIVEAFYVLKEPGKSEFRLVWVERPLLNGDPDGWQRTYNVSRMLERFVELANNSLYLHLRRLGVELETNSVLDTMHTLANLYEANPDEETLRKIFEDTNWVEGAQAEQDVRYKRQHFTSRDQIEKQTTLFEE